MADIRDIRNYYTDSDRLVVPQAIHLSKKTDKWLRDTLDNFESIGVNQVAENMKFAEYRRMYFGNVSYMDFDEVPPNLATIKELRGVKELPTYFHHYDILGLFINTFVGEFLELTDKFKVTNIDPIASNEYDREKNRRLKQYLIDSFNLEFEKILLELKIDTSQKFETEEEQQAYLQQLEQLKNENKPEYVDSYMRTNWRTKAAIWGQHVLNRDKDMLNDIIREEAISYMVSGRFFRHYRVGYDNYEPEGWRVEQVFFSRDMDILYPQKAEYVGRITLMSPNQIIERWGYLMNAKQIEKISGSKDNINFFTNVEGSGSFDSMQRKMYSHSFVLPFKGYDEYNFGKTLESMSGIPMGTKINPDGSFEETWIPDFNKQQMASNLLTSIRDDITVRDDVAQVTEVYWKSPKRVGLLTFVDKGIIKQEIVDDTILPDFLKHFGIKKVSTVSLAEAEKNPKVNTIVYTYVPEVRHGIKINADGTYLDEDIYLDGEPLEFQIRGNSNVYDLLLPVGGIITDPPIKKILPYQLQINVQMNQIYKYSENELGLFWLIDWGILGSEYKDMDSTEDALINLRDSAKNLGFVMGDSTNDQYRKGVTMPPITPIDASYTGKIMEKLQVVDALKWQALEKFGITPQRLGQPNKYETAEGVKQVNVAGYNQTAIHFNKMENARNKLHEIHLAVAQYAQKSGKDIGFHYETSDGEQIRMQLEIPNFHQRKLGIRATSDARKAKQLENFKNAIINSNTIGNDLLSFAEMLVSENTSELLSIARERYERQMKEQEAQRQHEAQMNRERLAAAEKEKQEERAFKDLELEKKLASEEKRAYLKNLGNAVDNNANKDLITMYDKLARQIMEQEKADRELGLAERNLIEKSKKTAEEIAIKQKQLEQKDRELDLKEQDIKTKRYTSEINKN